MKNSAILLIVLLTFFSCRENNPANTDGQQHIVNVNTQAPPTWKVVNFNDRFSFSVPPTMDSQYVVGFDSEVGRFANDSIVLKIDYGFYSNNLSGYEDRPQYRDTVVYISGREAKEVFFYDKKYDSLRPYIAGVYFPNVDNGTSTKLSIFITNKVRSLQDTSRIIIETIKFN